MWVHRLLLRFAGSVWRLQSGHGIGIDATPLSARPVPLQVRHFFTGFGTFVCFAMFVLSLDLDVLRSDVLFQHSLLHTLAE